jgi:hypothetical protein
MKTISYLRRKPTSMNILYLKRATSFLFILLVVLLFLYTIAGAVYIIYNIYSLTLKMDWVIEWFIVLGMLTIAMGMLDIYFGVALKINLEESKNKSIFES